MGFTERDQGLMLSLATRERNCNAQGGLGTFLVVLNATDAVVIQQSWAPTTSPLSFSHVAEDMHVRP